MQEQSILTKRYLEKLAAERAKPEDTRSLIEIVEDLGKNKANIPDGIDKRKKSVLSFLAPKPSPLFEKVKSIGKPSELTQLDIIRALRDVALPEEEIIENAEFKKGSILRNPFREKNEEADRRMREKVEQQARVRCLETNLVKDYTKLWPNEFKVWLEVSKVVYY